MKRIKEFAYERNTRFLLVKDQTKLVVDIKIPDLTKNKVSLWGDWGPMYKFYLDHKDPLKIAYAQSENEKPALTAIDISTVDVSSPMLGEERSVFPLSYVIADPQHQLVYKLFLNKNWEIAKVKALDLRVENLSWDCPLCSLGFKTGA